MPRFKLIVEVEYDVNPENYPGCETIEDMVDIDLTTFRENPDLLLDYLGDVMGHTVKVVPV